MRRTLPLAALLLLLGCAGAATAPPTTAPPAAAPAAVALPDDVRWVKESAEFAAAAWQAYTLARERIEEKAAGRAAGSWAVSLDGDETVLSNLQYEIEHGGAFDDESWRRWVARREATAIPGAREFLHRVRELGGRIVIVTNRKEVERADTEANLRALDLPFDVVLARGAAREKEPRWDAVAAGTAGIPAAEILLWVGDNIQDFPGLDQNLRKGPEAGLAAFGERYILIPNPMYGSWKP